jgi:hypothetical protein
MNALNTNWLRFIRLDAAVAVLTVGMVFGEFFRFVA